MASSGDFFMLFVFGLLAVACVFTVYHYQTVSPLELMEKINYEFSCQLDSNYPNEQECAYYQYGAPVSSAIIDRRFSIAVESVYSTNRVCMYHNGTIGLDEFIGNMTRTEFEQRYFSPFLWPVL